MLCHFSFPENLELGYSHTSLAVPPTQGRVTSQVPSFWSQSKPDKFLLLVATVDSERWVNP